MLADRWAWLLALTALMLARCQFANSPASPAPTPVRAASAAATATPTRLTSANIVSTSVPTQPAAPTPVRSATPVRATPAAPTPTNAPRVPTLGRSATASSTPRSGSGVGAILPPGQERLTGDVKTFAASARVLLVSTDGGGERQVSLSPSATIKRADGSTGTAADLGPGQRVQATGRTSGDAGLVAEEIVLLAPR